MAPTYRPISRRTGIPLREQVRQLLAEQIERGELTSGERLLTEAEMARQLNVSLAPVRSALGDLADAGLIRRQAGLGTFVAEPPIIIAVDLLPSFTSTLRAAGVPFRMDVVNREVIDATDEIATALSTSRAIWLRRTATIAGRRCVVLQSWLAYERFTALLDDETFADPQSSLYGHLLSRFGVRLTPGPGELSVSACGSDLLSLLDVPFGAPVVTFRSSGMDSAGGVAEVAQANYDATMFVFNINQAARREPVGRSTS